MAKTGILNIHSKCLKNTNLPVEVRLQVGARVLFLTNNMIAQGILINEYPFTLKYTYSYSLMIRYIIESR